MAETIQILAAKSEIADLVHTYALNVRKRAAQDNAALFTEDASFEVRELHPVDAGGITTRRRSKGLAEVMASITASTTTHHVFPAIHNLIIQVDGDHAEATSLMISTAFPGRIETLGEYEDYFRREKGKWLFSARTYTIYRG